MKLDVNKLTYKPDKEYFLRDISIEFESGKLYTLLGRTLSGKTSLLKTIAGLQPIDSGGMIFDGKDFTSVPVWNRNVAMVYQQFINYPHLNVFENIAFPLKQRKIKKTEIEKEVSDALNKVGLLGFEKRAIQELSGGQQQRVALARSLVKKAKILLLDEPINLAATTSPFSSRTAISFAPATTWWFVTTCPARSQTKPEPVPPLLCPRPLERP